MIGLRSFYELECTNFEEWKIHMQNVLKERGDVDERTLLHKINDFPFEFELVKTKRAPFLFVWYTLLESLEFLLKKLRRTKNT